MEKSDIGINAGLHFKYKRITITVVGPFTERTRSEVFEAQIF